MNRTLACCGLVLVLASSHLWAQDGDSVARSSDVQRATWRRATVHWGKWGVAALAATFTVLGAHEHQNSNRVFSELLDLCRASSANCTLAPDGSYRNPTAERLYQTSIHYDRRARLRLLLGQVSLLASASLFLADLRHGGGGPENIPFRGAKLTVEPIGGGAQVGMRVAF